MKKICIYLIVLLSGIAVFYLQFSYNHTYAPNSFYQVYLDNEQIGVINSKDKFDNYVSSQGQIVKDQVSDYKRKNERIESVYETFKGTIGKKNQYYSVYKTLLTNQSYLEYIYKNTDENGNIISNKEEVVKFFGNLPDDIKNGSIISKYKITNYDSFISNLDNKISINQKTLVDFLYQYKDVLELPSGQKSMFIEYAENYDNYKKITYSKYLYQLDYVDKYDIYLSAKNIYEPLGIYIKKVNTYDNTINKVENVYSKIIEKKPCTVEGYKFRIKTSSSNRVDINTLLGSQAKADYNDVNGDSSDIIIYVTEEKVFRNAVEEFITIFLGEDVYEAYKNKTQKEIETTGTIINNVYIDEDITFKKTNISIEEKIYNNENDLASYLLYGDDKVSSIVKVSSSDNISDLALKYGISIEEFFLSNPNFDSLSSMFYDGQEVVITKVNPKISVVVDQTTVEDKVVQYQIVEKYDNMMLSGSEYVEQAGSNGIMRVAQNLKIKNGNTQVVTPISNTTIKNPKDRIVLVGTKQIPTVGSVKSWGWPTCNGYTITSHYGWRKYPFGAGRELHAGIDLAGCGYGSPIYASNNGTIHSVKSTKWNYGKHIIINHHNGYYTLYAHMSGFAKGIKNGATVARGQVIGYMGHTGAATGTHLHFEIRVGSPKYSAVVNPYPYLMKR